MGNVGSGKTAMMVREMLLADTPMYSNILTKKVDLNHVIDKSHIFKQTLVKTKADGTDVFKYELNKEYWNELRKKNQTISVILDEAHTLMNARRAMSKKSEVLTDFLALLRRILGNSDGGYGELVLISQLERRLDVIAREMATIVQYCIGHFSVVCPDCGVIARQTNETPKKIKRCLYCNKKTKKQNHIIEVHSFSDINKYHMWQISRMSGRACKSYYERYFIYDIELVFPHYDTLQWENLLSD